MRRRFVWALGLAVLVACSDDDPADPGPEPEGGTISGSVVDLNGEGVGGVTVSADGPTDGTATTAANGDYMLEDLEAGDYTVSVEAPSGYVIALGASDTQTTQLAAAATANGINFRVATEEDADVLVVTLQGTTFEPADATISPGERIRWVNVSGGHTVTPDGHDEWENQVMDGDQTFEHRFESAGEFDYFCQPHQSAGMTGVIHVEN